jgi:hypothetical protein
MLSLAYMSVMPVIFFHTVLMAQSLCILRSYGTGLAGGGVRGGLTTRSEFASSSDAVVLSWTDCPLRLPAGFCG